ncbi:hypothetical protein D9M71_202730 [compost metagenome]
MKRQPHRALAIGHPAAVPRRVPRVVGLCGVLHQCFEERWQQAVQVVVCRPRHLPGQKRHGVFKQIENATQLVQLAHDIGRGIFQGHLLAQGKDRQVRRTQPGQADQLDHVLQQMSIFTSAFGSDQHAGQAMMGRSQQAAFSIIDRRKNAEAILGQFLGNTAHALTG